MLNSIQDTIFYHVYTLGFCGVLKKDNCSIAINKLSKFDDNWIKHLVDMGITAIYLGPIFESTYHGYDTKDYYKIDERLGSNDDFKKLVKILHENNIKVVVDGVFNHVGREFWAFKDVLKNKYNSDYSSWFNIDFNRNNNYNDGFYYDGWEGHYELVKLNLSNNEVKTHLFDAIKTWVNDFGIDGIRLDVAYCLPKDFIKELKSFCNNIKPDLWLMGEIIHGDYNSIVGSDLLDSATNYEIYKGLYSSHNDKNYFEIAYSLNRQFGDYGIYKDLNLYNFVDNHDVNRLATMVNDKRYLNNIYTLLFTIPGIPSIYYGSEWAIEGDRKITDLNLRPELSLDDFKDNAEAQQMLKTICNLSKMRNEIPVLTNGKYKEILVRNKQFVYARTFDNKWAIIILNLDDCPCDIEFSLPISNGVKFKIYNDDTIINYSGKIKLNINAFSSLILYN